VNLIDIGDMIYVGISGWNYRGWRGNFYPRNLAQKDELYYASRRFNSIEINGTFYSLKNKEIYQRWYSQTPENFRFSIKANRYLTHIKKLNHIQPALNNFLSSGMEELKEKLGPILWQFPPNLKYDPEKWDLFLKLLPKSFSEARRDFNWKIHHNQSILHAVEIRNSSFYHPGFIKQLRNHHVTLVFSDSDGRWPYMEDVSGDFIYLRLHGQKKLYTSNYGPDDLIFWKRRICKWSTGNNTPAKYSITKNIKSLKRDVYVYFDNDAKVYAPYNAITLNKLIQKSSV